jgi:hypothetical protein
VQCVRRPLTSALLAPCRLLLSRAFCAPPSTPVSPCPPPPPPAVPLFLRAASHAPVRFSPHLLPLCRPSAPPSYRRSGAIARACAGAARTLRRPMPTRARLGRAHAAQAKVEPGQAGPRARRASRPCRHCATGPRRIRPSDS